MQILASLTQVMCEKLGVENEVFVTKDALDSKESNVTEDEFINNLVVYLSSIQNSICEFSNKITEIFENNIINK